MQNRASGQPCRYCAWPHGSPCSGGAGASLAARLPRCRRARRCGRHRGHLGERHLASSVIMAVRTYYCSDPCPSACDRRQERVTFSRSLSAVRTVECLGEYTVLMVVVRQGADVRRHRARPVLGACLGHARRGSVDYAGTLAQVRWHFTYRVRLACVFDFAPPAGFEPAHTAPECNPAYRRYQQERDLRFMHGARMGRANRRPQIRHLPPLRQ